MQHKSALIVTLAALTLASTGSFADERKSAGAKQMFDRSKPHVNTIVKQKPKGPGSFTGHKFADLAPLAKYPVGSLPGAPMSGFCGTNQGGGVAKYIVVGVKNNGEKPGGAFFNRITFPNALPAERVQEDPYHDSGPGFGTAYVGFKIPASAWKNGKAKYVIKVDSKLDVKESNEGNNIATGYCVEPAT